MGAIIVTAVPFRTIYLLEAVGLVLAALYLTVGTSIQPEPLPQPEGDVSRMDPGVGR